MSLKMLPLRQKHIVDIIRQSGLNHSNFEFKPINNDSFTLHYKPNAEYSLTVNDKKHYIKPALDGKWVTNGETANWDTALQRLEYWLKAIKQNIEVGNPWEDFESFQEKMNDMNFDSYEEFFNSEEQSKIEKKLDLLFIEIEKLSIDTSTVRQDLEHLKTMSSKISKKDWILLLIGTVASWTLSKVLSAEHSNNVWSTVTNLFSSLKTKLLG